MRTYKDRLAVVNEFLQSKSISTKRGLAERLLDNLGIVPEWSIKPAFLHGKSYFAIFKGKRTYASPFSKRTEAKSWAKTYIGVDLR